MSGMNRRDLAPNSAEMGLASAAPGTMDIGHNDEGGGCRVGSASENGDDSDCGCDLDGGVEGSNGGGEEEDFGSKRGETAGGGRVNSGSWSGETPVPVAVWEDSGRRIL